MFFSFLALYFTWIVKYDKVCSCLHTGYGLDACLRVCVVGRGGGGGGGGEGGVCGCVLRLCLCHCICMYLSLA